VRAAVGHPAAQAAHELAYDARNGASGG
jgi:hypothetical protein